MTRIRNRQGTFLVMAMALLAAGAPAAVPDLLQPDNLKTIGCAAPDTRCMFVAAGQAGNVFYPGEPVDLTLRLTGPLAGAKSVTLEVVEIAMRQNRYLSGWSTMTPPATVENLGTRGKVTVPVAAGQRSPRGKAGEAVDVQAKDLPVPQRYGTYVITAAPDGKDAQFLCTLLRAMQPRDPGAPGFVDAPVFGEGQFITHDSGKPEHVSLRARTLGRLGIKGVRIELGWSEPRPGEYDWRRFDVFMDSLAQAKIKALVTMGGHPSWAMPLGFPTPACIPEKPDHSCMPMHYDAFGRWIRAFCQRYWKDGQGALWAIEHWNEPWEGISISGWESDSNHYRELMKRIADNARAVDPRIKTAAACSIMNTEDKFLVGENRRELAKLVDLFTDHYVPPRTSYGPMVAKFWGKQSTDTESWIAATEMLLPQVMCQFLACGQDRVTPWHPAMTYFSVPGSPMQFQMPNPVALASNVFNVFVTGRPFRRMLFLNHLPWAFQFGDGDEAVVVFFGRLMAPHGSGPWDNLWWQVNLAEGGSIAIDNADGALEFHDIAGNREHQGKKSVSLPMDYLAHYVRAPKGGAELIAQRLSGAKIEGVRPVEIIARDLTAPVDSPAAAVTVTLHNLLNAELAGTLSVRPPEGVSVSDERRTGFAEVKLAAGESKDFRFAITHATPSPANAYLFSFFFHAHLAARPVLMRWQENLHVLVARKGSKKIDGELDDWKDDFGVLVSAALEKADPTEQVWMPFLKFKDAQPDGSFAEVKLAWDASALYVAARVNDPSDSAPHQRLQQGKWDEDQYFRGAKDDAVCEGLRPFEKLVLADMRNKDVAARVQKDTQWAAYQKFLAEHPDADQAVKTNAARGYFEARRRNPKATFADASHVYKRVPWNEQPWAGDTFQFGLDLVDGYYLNMKPDTDRVPYGFHAMPDTDYEYAAYACADGGTELWRLLAPGVPRGHYYPRQPRARYDQGPVAGAGAPGLAVKRSGTITTYELALPWAELRLGDVPWSALKGEPWSPRPGATFGFIFRVNNNKGPRLTFGAGKSATKTNGLSLHPYWEAKPSCTVRWALGD